MFKSLFSPRSLTLVLVTGLSVLFTSCLKESDRDEQPPSAAGLMAFNLTADKEPVAVTLSGNVLGTPLAYSSYTGRYLSIFTGSRNVASYIPSSELLDSVSYNFKQGEFYSVFVVGSNGNYRNVVVEDDFDSLTASSGKAYVRYINGVSNVPSSAVTVSRNGSNLINDNAALGQVSPFVAVDPGDISVNISNEGGVAVNRTITVAQRKAYTILLSGLPNQTDSSRSVQIKFIENGTVTD